ncbi:NmrA-like family domain-containing protein, partial [Lachnellula suecica]
LSSSNAYNLHLLTRTTTSPSALALASLPNVILLPGDAFHEPTLHAALSNISIAFINTNGFAIGEKAEIYWGIRIFEMAREHKVSHFIWANLESSYRVSGYEARFRTGHFEGKDKVASWIGTQPKQPMKWSVLTSCMYIETLSQMLAPVKTLDVDGEEEYVFIAPVGSGAPPMIYLEDLGRYARWVVEHPERSNGMDLKIATAHVGWKELAETFAEVTGKKARFQDVSLDEYFASGVFPAPDAKVGHSVGHEDETLQTYRQNFSGFWNTWKENVLVRDLSLLEEILPDRVKSVGEWMKLTGYTGERSSVLKDYADGKRKVEMV